MAQESSSVVAAPGGGGAVVVWQSRLLVPDGDGDGDWDVALQGRTGDTGKAIGAYVLAYYNVLRSACDETSPKAPPTTDTLNQLRVYVENVRVFLHEMATKLVNLKDCDETLPQSHPNYSPDCRVYHAGVRLCLRIGVLLLQLGMQYNWSKRTTFDDDTVVTHVIPRSINDVLHALNSTTHADLVYGAVDVAKRRIRDASGFTKADRDEAMKDWTPKTARDRWARVVVDALSLLQHIKEAVPHNMLRRTEVQVQRRTRTVTAAIEDAPFLSARHSEAIEAAQNELDRIAREDVHGSDAQVHGTFNSAFGFHTQWSQKYQDILAECPRKGGVLCAQQQAVRVAVVSAAEQVIRSTPTPMADRFPPLWRELRHVQKKNAAAKRVVSLKSHTTAKQIVAELRVLRDDLRRFNYDVRRQPDAGGTSKQALWVGAWLMLTMAEDALSVAERRVNSTAPVPHGKRAPRRRMPEEVAPMIVGPNGVTGDPENGTVDDAGDDTDADAPDAYDGAEEEGGEYVDDESGARRRMPDRNPDDADYVEAVEPQQQQQPPPDPIVPHAPVHRSHPIRPTTVKVYEGALNGNWTVGPKWAI